MQKLSRIQGITQQAPLWLTGTIESIQDDGMFSVLIEEGQRRLMAQKAFSCLMQPVFGDKVCLFQDEQNMVYIMSVLSRMQEDESQARLEFAGKLSLVAQEDLLLKTDNKLFVEADHLQGAVRRINWISKLVNLTNKEMFIVSGLARLSCKVRELLTESLHVKTDNSVRITTQTEWVRVNVHDLKAKSVNSMEAPCTLIKGDRLVKVDSSQVHIG